MAYIIPGFVFILYTCFIGAEFLFERHSLQEGVAEQQKQAIQQQLFRMQYAVDVATKTQDLERIEQEISLATTDLNIMVYVLLDSRSKISYANHVVWRNSHASQVIDGYNPADHARVVKSSKPYITTNWQRLSIQAYYPVALNHHLQYADKVDLIYLEYDLSNLITSSTNHFRQRMAWLWFGGCLFIVLFAVLFHFSLFIPLNQLNRLAKSADKNALNLYKASPFNELNVLHRHLIDANAAEKHSLEQLQDTEQRWLFAVEASRNGIWDWNIATGDVYMSDRWKEILGYEPHELEGEFQDWEGRIHPEDRVAVLLSLQNYLNGDTDSFESVHRLRHKDGHYIWILDRGMLIDWDSDGRPTRIVGLHTDLSRHAINYSEPSKEQDLPDDTSLNQELTQLMDDPSELYFNILLHVHIDNFSSITHSLNEDDTERLCIQIVARLSRQNTFVSQVADGAFCLVVKNLTSLGNDSSARALAFASEVHYLVSQAIHISNQDIQLNASIGICILKGNELFDPIQVKRYAFTAAKAAMVSPDSTCLIYSDHLDLTEHRIKQLSEKLKPAIENGELNVYFQPIVDGANCLVAIEAVTSWEHAEFGLITERELQSVVEYSGVCTRVVTWQVTQVCELLKRIKALNILLPRVTLNIGVNELMQADVVRRIISVVDSFGVSPHDIELEIKEEWLLNNLNMLKQNISDLRQYGFAIVVDDFGGGLSCFKKLSELPISKVKLYVDVITSIGKTSEPPRLIKSLISAAGVLGFEVAAQAVETAPQMSLLNGLGCRYFQGPLYGNALTTSELMYVLQKGEPLPQQRKS